MQHPTTAELIELLPGAWRIVATNIPAWLDGERRNPRLTYEVVSTDPVRLTTEFLFDLPDGTEARVLARERASGDTMVRRLRGVTELTRQRWHVDVADPDRGLLIVRTHAGFRTREGIELLLRSDADVDGIRRHVAGHTEPLGLSPEEFASLTWLSWA
jgi:hypothetical protein